MHSQQQCPIHRNINKLLSESRKRGHYGTSPTNKKRTTISKDGEVLKFESFRDATAHIGADPTQVTKYLQTHDAFRGWAFIFP